MNKEELLFEKLYEKTKDCGRVQFVKLLMTKERENQELKKQLEDKYEKVGILTTELLYEENTELINQQKEFIKYLEDETGKWHNNYDSYNYEYEIEEPTAEELVNEILQKYKNIVGVENDRD